MDLFGFYNAFEKSYHETEFFNALYLANQPEYRDTLFFIILDEMNLSRPEHYFADFLSKLEQPEAQRRVKLDNVPEDICPKSVNGGMLPIPPMFVLLVLRTMMRRPWNSPRRHMTVPMS